MSQKLLSFLCFFTLATPLAALAQQPVGSPSRNRSVSGTNPNTSNPFAAQQSSPTTIGSTGVGTANLISPSDQNNRFRASGWSNGTTVNSNAYFYWTVQPGVGQTFPAGNLQFTLFRNEAGPQEYVVRSSLDSFASDVSRGQISGNSARISIPFNLPEGLEMPADSPVVFRLYAYNARADFGTLTLSDLGYAGAVLPVSGELNDFTGTGNENGAVLTWKTAYENGLSRYEIERSADGKIFELIGSMPIRNEAVNFYRYEDLKPYRTRNFYRLAVVDISGKRNTSRAVLVSGTPITAIEGPLTATPNPLTGSELTVNHPAASPNALLKITDMEGQEIYAAAVEEGTIVTTIQNLALRQGRYYLTLENGNQRYSTTLVK